MIKSNGIIIAQPTYMWFHLKDVAMIFVCKRQTLDHVSFVRFLLTDIQINYYYLLDIPMVFLTSCKFFLLCLKITCIQS